MSTTTKTAASKPANGWMGPIIEHCKEEAFAAAGRKPPYHLPGSPRDVTHGREPEDSAHDYDDVREPEDGELAVDLSEIFPEVNPAYIEWIQTYFRTLERCKTRMIDELTIELSAHAVLGELNL